MNHFLRDGVTPLYWADNGPLFGRKPDSRILQAKSHMRLDKFIAQQLGVSRAIAGRDPC
jgi:16S rRNA pseudouridine516 synthase